MQTTALILIGYLLAAGSFVAVFAGGGQLNRRIDGGRR